ncbi:MAG TPA: CapA family protein [Polyangiaceae bacterium]|nr:CapA family protein [Polyangiaceae bacterium]
MDALPVALCLCGDVMTARGVDQILPHPCSPAIFEPYVRDARQYVEMAESTNGPIARPVDFGYPWGDATRVLASVDLRIANLETAVTADGVPWTDKGIHYRMHPDNVRCLAAARLDVCTLANNHALDWGRGALLETLDSLHRAGIATAGAGPKLAEAQRFAFLPVRAGRVGVLALGASSSGIPRSWAAKQDRAGLWMLRHCTEREADAVGERIARTKRRGDIVIASLHWGSNWGYEVPDEHVAFAHALIERGVDVIHGHSSHHLRPIEVQRDRLVLYGCGDFLNDYEGIAGHEDFRPDLALAYLPKLDPTTGRLLELRMAPWRIRRMRLESATLGDAAWMAETLSRIGAAYGTRVAVDAGGYLALAHQSL